MKVKILLWVFILIFTMTVSGFADEDSSARITLVGSNVCKECHSDIHDFWKNSMHANSFADPIFNTAYEKAVNLSEESKTLCLRCHAPVTQLNLDYEMKYEVTREGVTCDFCHAVVRISLQSENFAYEFQPNRSRMGPLRNADSPIHETAYSELHTKSEFCAGCHEFTNRAGVKLLGTYSEWKNSPYASGGVQCQQCHMPATEGLVVRPAVKRTSGSINLHNLQGGHSMDKVKSAASVRIDELKKFPGSLRVEMQITNKGSGHYIPTGTPSRELLLEVSLVSVPENKLIQKKEVSFKKIIADSTGKILETDAEIMVKADRILSDTRIAPREKRTVNFTFINPPPDTYKVRAKLYYSYLAETSADQFQQMLIEMASDEKPFHIE